MIVVAWNMGRRDHAAACTYLLDNLAPDLALLQETSPSPEALQGGDVLHGRAYEAHTWGSAVYVREGLIRELPRVPGAIDSSVALRDELDCALAAEEPPGAQLRRGESPSACARGLN